MALSDLLAAIEADAATEVEQAEDTATRQAEQVIALARGEAEQVIRQARRDAERRAAAHAATALSAERAAAAGRYRAAREAALDDVLSRARADLAGLRGDPRYPAVLAGLLAEALADAGPLVRIRVDRRDATQVRQLLSGCSEGHGSLGDAPPKVVLDLTTAGGVVVEGVGRRVDNTVEHRLEAAWPALRGRIALRWDRAATATVEGGAS